ncbi:PREDICTED: gem-associated protein 2 isoform X1 [Odobenus rosmarus divergens]|uniref:Gem-associated protein 2 n=1 Tax=Odobenus rosmarus divergens TaxID=9708 RepID=A0A2U3VWR3_ODORO|nr:PREDICTED: gem-associated protein 2 isoform X1 [Odobenus rosmarus divergens]
MRWVGLARLKTMAWIPVESAVEELMPRLLPVEPCDLTESFDPSVPPRTPQEYLRRVQIEAAQCPDVVVAQIDPKKLKRKQSVNVSPSGCQPAPEGYSPTLQWQQQLAQFSSVRQSVIRHRSHWKSQQLDSNVAMPKSEDEEGWKKFCLGERLYAEGAVGPATSEGPGIDYVQIGFPPLLSIVSRMNQATVTSVLEYLSNWFGERDFTPELGRWLYALLACLEKPLLPEAHSLIRQLARRCSEVRLLVDSKDDERVPALNLLICLVSRYFDQRDLADEPS